LNQNAAPVPGGIFVCSKSKQFHRTGTNKASEHPSDSPVEPPSFLKRRSPMKKHIAVSLLSVALLVPGAAFAQSTTARGAANGAAAGGNAAGPVGEIVGGTVGAAVGAAVEIPNAVITSIQGERAPSVRVQERIVVGEPLPPTVHLRTVPRYSEYRYAVVNDQRVIVDPRTRRVIRIID
jgi:hypothetical protein